MSKVRFGFVILIIIDALVLIPLALINLLNYYMLFIITVIIVSGYFITRNNEKKRLIEISKIFLDKCDPERYVFEYQKFINTLISRERNRVLYKITLVLGYLTYGNLEEAKKILDELIDEEPKLELINRFWYYKTWIYYFEETKNYAKCEILLKEVQKLVSISPIKYKMQLILNYNQMLARFYVANKINLDKAENEFSKVFKTRLPKLNIVTNVYYLGVIAYLKNDYTKAIEYFNSVIKNGNKLAVVEKAKNYLNIIERETNLIH